jgi:hypothetical protein
VPEEDVWKRSPQSTAPIFIGTTSELTVYLTRSAHRVARFLSGRSEIDLGRVPGLTTWPASLRGYLSCWPRA